MNDIYEYPQNCISCGSSNLRLRHNPDAKTNSIYITCVDCGKSWFPGKVKNLDERTNTTLNNWARAVKHRYNDTCAICGCKEGVEAHHIIPVSFCRQYAKHLEREVNNGIALCEKHHKMAHGIAPET